MAHNHAKFLAPEFKGGKGEIPKQISPDFWVARGAQ